MVKKSEIELRVDRPAVGVWNMAVDEVLLERAAGRGRATLRFYEWSPATLSLGYFQQAVERDDHGASRACPLVRRSSGGGAILHDRELTYSLSLPTTHPLAADALALYRLIHNSLVETLGEFDITARLNERTVVSLGGEPFLCFQRRAVGDVLVGEYKICGSAQRRSKGAILQHGSVLVSQSPCAPELPGLVELSGRTISTAALAEAWIAGLRRRLSSQGVAVAAAPRPADEAESPDVERIIADKYGNAAWTNRR